MSSDPSNRQRTLRVVGDDAVMGGEPRTEDLRSTVRQIAEWVEGAGLSARTVAGRYDLDVADVYHALAYYHEHPSETAAAERRRAERIRDARDRGMQSLAELDEKGEASVE
ncbi:MAG: DUF433 domain-containing protein [Haloarculaceae archaeon]